MGVFDDICEGSSSVVLVQGPTVFAHQSEFDILLSWSGVDSRCVCVGLSQRWPDHHRDRAGIRSGAERRHAGGGNRTNGE